MLPTIIPDMFGAAASFRITCHFRVCWPVFGEGNQQKSIHQNSAKLINADG